MWTVRAHADHLETLAVIAAVESVQSRHFLAARRTPGRPEVDDNDFPVHSDLDRMSDRPIRAGSARAQGLPTVAEANASAATQMIAPTPTPANHNVIRLTLLFLCSGNLTHSLTDDVRLAIVTCPQRIVFESHHVSDRLVNPAPTTAAPSTPRPCRFRTSNRGRLDNNRADSDGRTPGHIRSSNAVVLAAQDSSPQPDTPALPDRRTGRDRVSRVRSRRWPRQSLPVPVARSNNDPRCTSAAHPAIFRR